MNNKLKNSDIMELIKYFDEYQVFCLDLSSDKVLKGELNFKYKWAYKMAVPKRKTSKSRRDKRRSHHKIKNVNITKNFLKK